MKGHKPQWPFTYNEIMPRQKNTKELIIKATITLMATKGHSATSTRAIAKIVEISENTIYRHFEDKEELIQNTLEGKAFDGYVYVLGTV